MLLQVSGAVLLAVKEESVVDVVVAFIAFCAVMGGPIMLMLVKQREDAKRHDQKLDQIYSEARGANMAVNCMPPGEPSLAERIRRREHRDEWRDRMVIGMARFIGFEHEPPPAYDESTQSQGDAA